MTMANTTPHRGIADHRHFAGTRHEEGHRMNRIGHRAVRPAAAGAAMGGC
jgi:hypothetical protein